MVFIQNPEATRAIIEAAGLTTSEGFPQNLANVAQPVIDMTPDFHRKTTVIKSIGSATTMLTTPSAATNKEFYLTGLYMSYTKVVTDTGTQQYLSAQINGIVQTICNMISTTLVVGTDQIYIQFPHPLKIDPGTAITSDVIGTFTGSIWTIFGYEVQR